MVGRRFVSTPAKAARRPSSWYRFGGSGLPVHHFEVWRHDQKDPVFVCGRCTRELRDTKLGVFWLSVAEMTYYVSSGTLNSTQSLVSIQGRSSYHVDRGFALFTNPSLPPSLSPLPALSLTFLSPFPFPFPLTPLRSKPLKYRYGYEHCAF